MAAISELFKEYIAYADLTENSIDIKRRAVKYFISHFGDVDPKVVTPKMAEDYKTKLCDGMRTKLKSSSKNSYIANIKPFFLWMQKRYYIPQNPFLDIKLFRQEKKIHEAYTPEDIARIFEIMKSHKHSQCLQTAFTLALCGMRKGEVFNMIAKDFCILDSGRGEIKLSHKEDGKYTWRWGTKSKSERYVPVPDWAREILLNRIHWLIPPNPYLAIPDCYYKRAMDRLRSGKFNLDDRNCAYINFYRDFVSILKRAGVGHKVLHDTRFTLCMTLYNKQIPAEVTQKILGHANISTTLESYMELDQRQLCREAGEKLEDYGAFLAP